MNIRAVDEVIQGYVDLRMLKGKSWSAERLLCYAHLMYHGEELLEFLRRVRGLSSYYMDFCSVMKNPLKGPEIAWLAALMSVGFFGCLLLTVDEYRFHGILLAVAVPANIWNLLKAVLRKRCEMGVLAAIYAEIADLAERERQLLV